MTEVMFEVVTLGFQGIIVFVFNLPPRPPWSNHLSHIAIVNGQGGGECIPIQNLAVSARVVISHPFTRNASSVSRKGANITVGVYFVMFAGPAFVRHRFDNAIAVQVINPFI